MLEVDKVYCMSSFLMHRLILNQNKTFNRSVIPKFFTKNLDKTIVYSSEELEHKLKESVKLITNDGKAALALSGGIDSAVLAKYMPKGSKAYTFKCIVPGIEVIDESVQAAKYAEECGLKHEVIEIYWNDMEEYAPLLMKAKGAPIHSIEVQIYKAALKAKEDGFDKFIFGETADINYGGLSGLLSRDWTIGEYIDRYSYVLPHKVLKDFTYVIESFVDCCDDNGFVDVHKHLRKWDYIEDMSCYVNACKAAGVKCIAPYSVTWMGIPLDYTRVRNGENKYFIRDIFKRNYSGWNVPEKIPMPRPMNEWLRDWEGPTRPEFWRNCTKNMTGDQKWLVWALENFLNMIEQEI